MARPLPFEILRDLAQESMQKAFASVGQAVAAENAAKQQLETLTQYRYDYLERLQASMQSGVRSSVASNAQKFIDNIDMAIARQGHQLQTLAQHVAKERERWMAERRKVESMSALLERNDKKQAVIQGRREQKSNDEFAARAFRRMQLT